MGALIVQRTTPPDRSERTEHALSMGSPLPGRTGRGTFGNPDADLRASDAERNEVAEKLSHHYADGRLDQTEFKSRLDRAMGATTRGDLGGLFDDLPPLAQEARRQTSAAPVGALAPGAFVAVARRIGNVVVHVPGCCCGSRSVPLASRRMA